MRNIQKKWKTWKKEIMDPHFLMVSIAGLLLILIGLFLFFTGESPQILFGLVLWSYGLVSLGFSVGFNFGKYGK